MSNRICIYSKDVQKLLGKSSVTAWRVLRMIRQSLGKEPHHAVTVGEFATFLNISEEEVRKNLSA